jgi:hypothetical protein
MLIGPANYAGQGAQWARAVDAFVPGAAARSVAVAIPGAHSFPADTVVPFSVYHHSRRWQLDERAAVVAGFDHVLVESMRRLFGSLYPDLASELKGLRAHGISAALMAHGTDVRSPRAHVARHRWSPYRDDPRSERLQHVADSNRALAESSGLPLFVSTPDLLDDLPGATWCPVVVDRAAWDSAPPPFSRDRLPVVAHIPSSAAIKGTALIEPALRSLAATGVIDYQRLEAVPSADMPTAIGDADVVLDQFRIGSYGVAACEAMAAGRIVIGHVEPGVRERVESQTGLPLPIVEADPETLGSVLAGLVRDPDLALRIAQAGPRFIDSVHSGKRSAAILEREWLRRSALS